MDILFLGGNLSENLANWLKGQGECVIYREDKVSLEEVRTLSPKFIISYNYRFLLSREILDLVEGRAAMNLHISLLPFNRGAHPNIWSFLDDTSKGVTIHCIDEGIDTGDILVQKEVCIDENVETLRSSYALLHQEIQELFKMNWNKIKRFVIAPYPQEGEGSTHYLRDSVKFDTFIQEKKWDILIRDFKKQYHRCISMP